MKWKDTNRVMDRIVELALGRATKGDAFAVTELLSKRSVKGGPVARHSPGRKKTRVATNYPTLPGKRRAAMPTAFSSLLSGWKISGRSSLERYGILTDPYAGMGMDEGPLYLSRRSPGSMRSRTTAPRRLTSSITSSTSWCPRSFTVSWWPLIGMH
jgi:hypothetical protein